MENANYIDYDGVIFDSDDKLREMKKRAGFAEHNQESYMNYFKYLCDHTEEWDYVLKEANPINNSIQYLKELEKEEGNTFILTKFNSFYETELKLEILRKVYNIHLDIIFVPPHAKKSDIVSAKNNRLVDDDPNNVRDWILNGGIAYLFDKHLKEDEENKICSLKRLLKK